MFEALSHHRDPIEAKLQSKPSPGLRPPSPAGRWCRAAADEGGQRLGQYHPSPGLRIGRCEVGPDSPIGRQPFISLFFLLPPRRVTGGKTTSTIRISPFLPQSRPNACPQRNETGSPETTSKTLSIATSHQPSTGRPESSFARSKASRRTGTAGSFAAEDVFHRFITAAPLKIHSGPLQP